jgi:hypothetical protein
MPPPLQTFNIFVINFGLDPKYHCETSKWLALEVKGFIRFGIHFFVNQYIEKIGKFNCNGLLL